MAGRFWRTVPGGLELRLRVTPNASRDAIEAIEDRPLGPALRIRVTAPPDRGRANRAVIVLLSRAVGVPKSAFAVTVGETARDKLVTVSGDPESLARALAALPS